METNKKDKFKRTVYKCSQVITYVAAAYIIIISILLLMFFNKYKQIKIAEPKQVTQLHSQLKETNFKDENLKQKVRDLDYIYRRAWYVGQQHFIKGINLLVLGILIFILFFNLSKITGKNLPDYPDIDANRIFKQSKVLRILSFSFGIILVTAVFTLYFHYNRKINTVNEPKKNTQTLHTQQKEFEKHWANFRGPLANGKTDENLLSDNFKIKLNWKVAYSSKGFSSPVIWGSKIFITGGNKDKLAIEGYNIKNGKLLWKYETPTGPFNLKKLSAEPGFASPTASVDHKCVFAIYATGLLVCVDHSTGKEIWRKKFPVPKINYGHSSSLLVHGKYLIVQYDMSNLQTIYCLDTVTGSEL